MPLIIRDTSYATKLETIKKRQTFYFYTVLINCEKSILISKSFLTCAAAGMLKPVILLGFTVTTQFNPNFMHQKHLAGYTIPHWYVAYADH